jgi:hypothetical protein
VLSDVFQKEVLKDTNFAWYVDHYTENAPQFGVKYLVQDPHLSWTNEALNQRDPNDLENTTWGPNEVASWFSPDPDSDRIPGKFKYVVRFVTRHDERHTLTLEAFKCDIDGQTEGVWERYVDQGVRGALEPFLSEFARLEAIEVHAV